MPTYGGLVGSATSKISGTMLSFATTAVVPAGSTLIVWVVDNATSNILTTATVQAGSTALTRLASTNGNSVSVGAFALVPGSDLPSGTTITITWPASVVVRVGWAEYWTGLGSFSASGTNTGLGNTVSGSVTVPAGGFALAAAGVGTANTASITWGTGITGRSTVGTAGGSDTTNRTGFSAERGDGSGSFSGTISSGAKSWTLLALAFNPSGTPVAAAESGTVGGGDSSLLGPTTTEAPLLTTTDLSALTAQTATSESTLLTGSEGSLLALSSAETVLLSGTDTSTLRREVVTSDSGNLIPLEISYPSRVGGVPSVNVKAQVLTIGSPTTTGTQTITHTLGVTPSAVIALATSAATSETTITQDGGIHFGVASSPTNQWSISLQTADNQTTAQNRTSIAASLISHTLIDGTVWFAANLVSWDSQTLTLQWTNVDPWGVSRQVTLILLASPFNVQAFCAPITETTTQTIHLGFTPSVVVGGIRSGGTATVRSLASGGRSWGGSTFFSHTLFSSPLSQNLVAAVSLSWSGSGLGTYGMVDSATGSTISLAGTSLSVGITPTTTGIQLAWNASPGPGWVMIGLALEGIPATMLNLPGPGFVWYARNSPVAAIGLSTIGLASSSGAGLWIGAFDGTFNQASASLLLTTGTANTITKKLQQGTRWSQILGLSLGSPTTATDLQAWTFTPGSPYGSVDESGSTTSFSPYRHLLELGPIPLTAETVTVADLEPSNLSTGWASADQGTVLVTDLATGGPTTTEVSLLTGTDTVASLQAIVPVASSDSGLLTGADLSTLLGQLPSGENVLLSGTESSGTAIGWSTGETVLLSGSEGRDFAVLAQETGSLLGSEGSLLAQGSGETVLVGSTEAGGKGLTGLGELLQVSALERVQLSATLAGTETPLLVSSETSFAFVPWNLGDSGVLGGSDGSGLVLPVGELATLGLWEGVGRRSPGQLAGDLRIQFQTGQLRLTLRDGGTLRVGIRPPGQVRIQVKEQSG